MGTINLTDNHDVNNTTLKSRTTSFVTSHHFTNARWRKSTSSRADGGDPCKFRRHLHKMSLRPGACVSSAFNLSSWRPGSSTFSLCHITFTHPPTPHLRSTPFHLDFHFAVTNEVTQARFSRGNRRTEPYKDAPASRMEVNDCERKSLRRSAGRGWRRGGFGSSLASGSSAGALLVKALGVLLPFNLQYFIRLAALCAPAINVRRCLRIYGLISL